MVYRSTGSGRTAYGQHTPSASLRLALPVVRGRRRGCASAPAFCVRRFLIFSCHISRLFLPTRYFSFVVCGRCVCVCVFFFFCGSVCLVCSVSFLPSPGMFVGAVARAFLVLVIGDKEMRGGRERESLHTKHGRGGGTRSLLQLSISSIGCCAPAFRRVENGLFFVASERQFVPTFGSPCVCGKRKY